MSHDFRISKLAIAAIGNQDNVGRKLHGVKILQPNLARSLSLQCFNNLPLVKRPTRTAELAEVICQQLPKFVRRTADIRFHHSLFKTLEVRAG